MILQFSLTTIFLICFFTIYDQLKFMKSMDLGFDKNQVIILDVAGSSLAEIKEKSDQNAYLRFKKLVEDLVGSIFRYQAFKITWRWGSSESYYIRMENPRI